MMPTDDPDAGFEPAWLWATRVTAEAARAALTEGRTAQERFAIYERLILAACQQREHGNRSNNPSYSYLAIDEQICISEFEDTDSDS